MPDSSSDGAASGEPSTLPPHPASSTQPPSVVERGLLWEEIAGEQVDSSPEPDTDATLASPRRRGAHALADPSDAGEDSEPIGSATTAEGTEATETTSTDFGAIVVESRPKRGNRPGSALDRWWAKVQSRKRNRLFWYWGGPIAVTVLGGLLRFWNLGFPRAFMFDETYYVKDALTLSRLGFEAAWPDEANTQFLAGNVDIFTATNPEFVVHPPLGKWIIWLGMSLFSPDDTVGWRLASAIMGTLAIFILAMLTRSLFRSTLLATIAGGLLAIDGLAITMSRIALLDQSVMFFVLLATYALLLDRRWYERRLQAALDRQREKRGPDSTPFLGPVVWWRPWLIACAVLLGAATAVKWSGLYFIAFYGVYVVLADVFLRRRLGVVAWYSAAVLKQAPVSAVLMLVPSFIVYLSSWTGWLVTDGGWGRHWADQAGNAATGFFAWVPTVFQSLWHYHVTAYNAALSITSPHSWAANPLTWPLMTRPTLVFRELTYAPDSTCGASECISTVSTIANPIIWWTAQFAVIALIVLFIRRRDWRIAFILLPIAAGFLPWLAYLQRTVFQIYTVAWLPFLILAIVYCLKAILGASTDPSRIRTPAVAVVGTYLLLAAGVSVFFFPLWVGTSIPYSYWMLHAWLPLTWQ